jgi:D-alanyl-D-alanine dipeptidase
MKLGKDVDMGGTFDFFGDISHPDYKDITKEQLDNRNLLKDTMIAHGFKQSIREWWHFTFIDEPYPNTYFTFPINKKSIKKTTN